MSAPAPLVFDLRAEPVELQRGEWAPSITRDPSALRGVIMHSWGAKVGTEPRLRRRYGGEAAALAHRALGTPYGISAGVTSAGVPVVVLAHPAERYTFASDDGNAQWLAIGVMGLFPAYERDRRPVHSIVTEGLRAAVDMALQLAAVEYLGGREGLDLIAHRQACNQPRDHFACCTEAVVSMVCTSPAVLGGLFVPRPDIVLNDHTARPWRADWRRHIAAAPVAEAELAVRFG